MCVCVLHTGANPLQTNSLGHAARAYAKEGEVGTILQEWEGKVCTHSSHLHRRTTLECASNYNNISFHATLMLYTAVVSCGLV